MGQSTSSCFADNTDGKEVNGRNAFHPLSSQDAERTRFQQKAFTSEASGSMNRYTAEKKVNSSNSTAWDKIPSLREEDKSIHPFDNFNKGNNTTPAKSPRKNQDSSQLIVNSNHNKKFKSKRIRLRWKNKDPLESTRSISNGIMTLRDDPFQRTLYYFADDNNEHSSGFIDMKPTTNNTASTSYIDESSFEPGSDRYTEIVEYTGNEITQTKLIIKEELEVKNALLKKMPSRGKKETFIEPILICGTQIYTKRMRVNYSAGFDSNVVESVKSFTLPSTKSSRGSNNVSSLLSIQDVDPNKTRTISNDTLREILKKKRLGEKNVSFLKDSRNSRCKGKQVVESRTASWSHNDPIQRGELLSATVRDGVSRTLFTPEAISETEVESVPEMVCVCSENDIYVCDIGLTSSRCDFIVSTSERCSNGSYNAYTYAKQTLGCREHDELAVVCEWPVMRAVVSIREHLEKVDESAPCSNKRRRRTLVLDDREPHIVKYDVSRKERQKLDMHTDKSEWTFLIALTDGIGDDYEGGGTYFECIDATVHLEKGHALIFPGKLRHRGQKIINGKRFLLVGFLVEKHDDGKN